MIQLELALSNRGPAVLTEREKIMRYRLMVLRKGVELEKLGMKKRGVSCSAVARKELGMPNNTKRDDLIAALTALIHAFDN
jgi:hypothetical protein